MQRIADRVKKLVNYHLFMVMVWNESSSHLECAFAKHYEEPITVELSVSLFKGITGHAAGTRISARVDDVRLDQRYIEFPHSDNVRSELVIPLLLQDRLIGVLDLESTKLSAFTLEHERMLEILGSCIAVALENSRLYEQSRDREQRCKRTWIPRAKFSANSCRKVSEKSPASRWRPRFDLRANWLVTSMIFFPTATGD